MKAVVTIVEMLVFKEELNIKLKIPPFFFFFFKQTTGELESLEVCKNKIFRRC